MDADEESPCATCTKVPEYILEVCDVCPEAAAWEQRKLAAITNRAIGECLEARGLIKRT